MFPLGASGVSPAHRFFTGVVDLKEFYQICVYSAVKAARHTIFGVWQTRSGIKIEVATALVTMQHFFRWELIGDCNAKNHAMTSARHQSCHRSRSGSHCKPADSTKTNFQPWRHRGVACTELRCASAVLAVGPSSATRQGQ